MNNVISANHVSFKTKIFFNKGKRNIIRKEKILSASFPKGHKKT